MPAEKVVGGAGTEAIVDQVVGAGEEPELVGGDDQVKMARAVAHRAIAFEEVEIGRRACLDPHPAAMTAARVPERPAGHQVRGAFHGAAKSAAR